MRSRLIPALTLSLLLAIPLAACDGVFGSSDRPATALDFPRPDRPVPRVVSNQFADEVARDERDEARIVMDLAEIKVGMTVADIGAGAGYYTVRLAERVGEEGRVLAQDIDWEALERLGQRVERERLENISIKPGRVDDPQLPADSFDRIFLVHMYHEVTEPYAFLWRMWPALAAGGEIVVVETDRPVGSHGIPHALLFCEFEAVGYVLLEFIERPDIKGYFARFGRGEARVEPEAIKPCSAP
ncbi:MAG: class I SAM-dependent methyltransferase [Erythrobacter sp.]|uniref:class I SAM-dependent methyltransferase n=1 Tax=Erythrobacter sp. HL-111 TaxID=1798193 RepID=UPI0006D976CD|nr:class I SAM-dependent methyltransferase [Erythrobacter sp. HL-111]KPP96603.1 MAG: Methylase involved in ubiquinone/menaquinone biosynthesis [Erythrobacteraceae bacterium HL-111]SDS01676.1 Methyltransferase domain-containing protein [Erythrobacter sp. HL-111]